MFDKKYTLAHSFVVVALLVAISTASAAGCGGKKDGGAGQSCDSVGAHFDKLARAEADSMAEDDPAKKAALAQMALLPKAKASLVRECRDEKWSTELRACFLAAADADQFRKNCATLIKRVSPKSKSTPSNEQAATPANKPVDQAKRADDKPTDTTK